MNDPEVTQYFVNEGHCTAVSRQVLDGREAEYVAYMTQFGEQYAARVREDHRIFVDAFRNHLIGGI